MIRFAVLLGLAGLISPNLSKAALPFGGSFMNFERNSTPEFIERELNDMKAAGMDTVIVVASGQLVGPESSTACASNEVVSALYQSSYFSGSSGKIDALMAKAAERNMKVFVGSLQTSGPWDSPHLRACNRKVVEELNAAFGQPTFAGMYFAQEIWMNSYAYLHSSSPAPAALFNFRADTRSVNSQLKVLIAPYFKKDSVGGVGGMTPGQASVGLNMIIDDTGVDIVAPQDGIGSEQGAPPLSEIGLYYEAMRNELRPGTELWTDLETFSFNPNVNNDKYPPAPISRIAAQVSAQQPFVSKIITWMFGRDMSPRSTFYPVLSGQLFRDYLNYYSGVSFIRVPYSYYSDNNEQNLYSCSIPNPSYPDPASNKFKDLIGGEYQAPNYSNWVGYNQNDGGFTGTLATRKVSLDLGQVRFPKKVRIQFLSETNSGIYFPERLVVTGTTVNSPQAFWGSRGQFINCEMSGIETCFIESQSFMADWIEVNLTGEATQYLNISLNFTNWMFIGEIEVLE